MTRYNPDGLALLQARINILDGPRNRRTDRWPACLICGEAPRMKDPERTWGRRSTCEECFTERSEDDGS